MSKETLYKWSTIFLLLINLGVLSFFFITKPSLPKKDNLRLLAKKEMNLSIEQEKLFLQSADKHKEQMLLLEDQQNKFWREYFYNLKINSLIKHKDSVITELQNIEKQKVVITSQHLEEVKSCLNPNQYDGFSRFLDRLLEKIVKKEKNNPPPPKDL